MEWNGMEWNGMWKDSSYFIVRNGWDIKYKYVDDTFSPSTFRLIENNYKRNVTDSSFESGGYRDDEEEDDDNRIQWGWPTRLKIREEDEGWPAHLDWGNTSD
jgi:hypothetical protein